MPNRFQGIYAPHIEQFIAFKRALGFKYQTEASIFAVFDRFTLEHGETVVGITRQLAEDWSAAGGNFSSSYNFHRAMLINGLASFLCEIGIPSYLMKLPKRHTDFTPHIYSDAELNSIFRACDNIRVRKGLRTVAFALPALIRLLYATGLRISEALALRSDDVNLDDQYLLVRDSKNGKERIIPFSDTIAGVLAQYAKHRDQLPAIVDRDECFFIALNGRRITPDVIQHRWWRKLLHEAGIPRNDHGPRLHDFRHSFSVHSLGMMAERGVDLYCSLPVLSTYLGHQSLEATNGYVRLVAAMYPGLLKDIDVICLNVFPITSSYETN